MISPEQRIKDAIKLGMSVTLRCESKAEYLNLVNAAHRLKAPTRVRIAPFGGNTAHWLDQARKK